MSRSPRHRPKVALLAVVLAAVAFPTQGSPERVAFRIGGSATVDAQRLLPLYRGTRTAVTVEGPGVERCERVELGDGVSVQAERLAKTKGRLGFEALTAASASLGPRELRIRFAIELAGPEVFPARVFRGGRVEGVSPRHVEVGRPVVLAFTGRDLGNADVLSSDAYRDAHVLPGGTESVCRVQITPIKEGVLRVALYDRDGPPMPAERAGALGGHTTLPGALVEVVRSGAKP